MKQQQHERALQTQHQQHEEGSATRRRAKTAKDAKSREAVVRGVHKKQMIGKTDAEGKQRELFQSFPAINERTEEDRQISLVHRTDDHNHLS